MIDELAIGERYRAVAGELNERQRRVWAGAEALSHGRGGQAAVVRATGMSATTVARGMAEDPVEKIGTIDRVTCAGLGARTSA